MKTLQRIVVEEALIGVVFLTAAWYAYYLVAVLGLLDHLREDPFKDYVTGPGIHIEILAMGLGFGVLLAFVNHLSEVPALRHRPIGEIIVLKSGLYVASLAVMVGLVHALFLLFAFSWEEIRALWSLFSPRIMISLGGWTALTFLSLAFLLEVRRKVGPGNLLALLTGRYHRPREESRVFLFLDLKGSTAIAEQLGHARYSQFLRHCYRDLTDSVLHSRAQIYQYVGDEVVLTWPEKQADAGKRSLETFFAFQQRLTRRQPWYEDSFGFAPEFRGGVELGTVTATEVGDIKREIAFHGDPLNTAARLLELCREFGRPVLVSGRVQEAIADEPGMTTELQGEITLRGKAEPVAVYGVDWTPYLDSPNSSASRSTARLQMRTR